MSTTIPIIDFGKWLHGSQEERGKVAEDLVSACRNVGFMYIINHGVDEGLVEEAFRWSQRLFNLPDDKKMLAPHPPGPSVHRGYSWPGLEKVSQYIPQDGDDTDAVDKELRMIQDYKESYEIGSEDFADQPNVWLPEDIIPGFRGFMNNFYWGCFDSAKEILRALAMGIGLEDANYFLQFHSGINNQLRLLHYPPVETEKLSRNILARMPAHSDWGSITMLFQDDCGGLQVEDPNEPGSFIDAPPQKGAMVVNIGDMMMRWSNDHLKSTLHRVNSPALGPESDGVGISLTPARYSIPYFVSPDPQSVIECLPCCTSEGQPAKYPPVTQRDYGKKRAKLQYTNTVRNVELEHTTGRAAGSTSEYMNG